MFVTVKNVGKGKSWETQANLRNLSGNGLLLHDGRFDISNMAPGETKRIAFTFDVQSALADPEAKVELSISDRDLRESVVEKVRIPIATPVAITGGQGAMKSKAVADLFGSPEITSHVFGRLPPNTAATVLGTSGDFVKLSLGNGRFGFAKKNDLENGGSPAATVAFDDALTHAVPEIGLQAPQLATRDQHLVIKGEISDDVRVLDAYVFVGSRKVWYKSNRNGADPKKLAYEADLPLRPGINVVSIYARQNADDALARKTFVIRKDGPNGELITTPKTDDDLAETGGAADD
jgi:carboxyl-terminal processing protease